MSKPASNEFEIHQLIAGRWSPYGFSDRPVTRTDLRSLFEAARWAASSYNEQPWRWIVGTKDDPEQYDRILSCLVEQNQQWARRAPVLVLCCAKKEFTHNGKPNRAAWHDIGLATANFTFEATSRGLCVHQMLGVLPDRARELFGIPEDAEMVTAIAVGYEADPKDLPDSLHDQDTAERTRRPLRDSVFGGDWGETADLLD